MHGSGANLVTGKPTIQLEDSEIMLLKDASVHFSGQKIDGKSQGSIPIEEQQVQIVVGLFIKNPSSY